MVNIVQITISPEKKSIGAIIKKFENVKRCVIKLLILELFYLILFLNDIRLKKCEI